MNPMNLNPPATPPTLPPPTTLVIFGVGGDLTWRKLIPALYNLFLDHWLPEQFAVIGVDRKPMNADEFLQRLRQGVSQFSRQGPAEDSAWSTFASRLSFMAGDFTDAATYTALRERLSAQEQTWGA